ncbi:MAG TPA: PEP/pyruvate-binding domain-containing protein [Desulfobulbales bacterium]|jgi:pyruvate, orthophosphate dikinase|nr:PEP/pyruvate-binding domain-containing protein [Desulfobulbales bacterium]
MATQDQTAIDTPAIDSDALRANLLETATDEVTIDPSLLVLEEIVENYKGISKNLHDLLYEVCHPYRNWKMLVPRVRAFALKNITHYFKHEKGPEAFDRFMVIFCQALIDSRKNSTLLVQTIESMLAYTDRLISLLDQEFLIRYEKPLALLFLRLRNLDDEVILFMVQGQHPMKRIAQHLLKLEKGETSYDFKPLADLMKRVFTMNYEYWMSEKDPLAWFTEECGDICKGWQAGQLFNAISHKQLKKHLGTLNGTDINSDPRQALGVILELPSHMDIVRMYKAVPEKLNEEQQSALVAAEQPEQIDRFGENRKLIFLFHIMETSGLALIHEETIREINRSLVLLIRRQTFEEIENFLLTTFQLLQANVRKYPHTSLQCIQVLGTEVFKRGNSRLVEAFLWESVRFGFQYANVTGVDEDWQPITNPAHLANIRVWLNLIMQEPKWCSTLFSALIINLKLSGTCVKDTDLFQRDITLLLNHPIEPVYNLFKQFAKLMPVFFNEIGAEGYLRDVSTEIDEIHRRKDALIHFLRKQSHVESSNMIVDFLEAIFLFWKNRDQNVLEPFLPVEVLAEVKNTGIFIDDMHKLMQRVFELPGMKEIPDLLEWKDKVRARYLEKQQDIAESEKKRFDQLVRIYKLLYDKYNLGYQEMRHQLKEAINSGFPEMEQLLADLEICDTHQCLNALLVHLEGLKEIILSKEKFEAKEDIYYKRHIAVDIPSVYGRYRERKFDALGLSFRLENLANMYLERLPETVNLSFITRATFISIIKCLDLYLRALRIDGITSRRLETYLELLSSSLGIKRFSYTQYLDIFRGLSDGVKDVIYAFYTNIHQNNLSIIIPQIGAANLLTKYRNLWDEKDIGGSILRLSEFFFRNLIAGTFGLQHLDNFITRIMQILESQKEVLDQESLDLLMTYNPENVISFLHNSNPQTRNLIHLGNKGLNLTQLASENKPVPPGFIITTEIFRCWPVVNKFQKARDEFMRQVRQSLSELEAASPKQYGYAENPLLLSVRSGASISMPGMMATIHNVGLNQDIVEKFAQATGKEYLAWDNYRRFLQSWGMAEGMKREQFQVLMNSAKTLHNVKVKKDFTPAQMKALALEYQKVVRSIGISIPDEPWRQLMEAVEIVLNSWNTPKTREYRALMDASDSWGTAVIIQAMVFGNLSQEAGSGVVFTAHPYRKVTRVALWGDYAIGDQGEDIVSGLVTTYPISIEQAEIDGRSQENTLQNRFPEIYKALLELSRELVYENRWNPQEIEFTFESSAAADFYILQTRDMITIKKKENLFVFEHPEALEDNFLGKGIGVSGSALSGRAVFTRENIDQIRREDPDCTLILIRQDTVPEDIKEIARAQGLLTARGGQTSHAAVVATQLEKTCVVGCKDLRVYESEQRCEINGHDIRFGEHVSIDGRKGLFLKGSHAIREEVHILPI